MYKEKLIEKLSEGLEGVELVHFQEAAELIEEEEGTSLLESLVALKDTIVEKCSTKKTVKEEDDIAAEMSDEEEHVRNMYNIALDLEEGGDNLCIDLPPHLGNGVDR